MAFSIKFTKFDNTPWGFRLTGGSDFPHPLTVIKVTEGSLAECMGLKVGDVVVRLNDQAVSGLTHGEAHEEIKKAGNNFLLTVQREPESDKTLEALQAENLVPYKSLQPLFPEQILHERTVFEEFEEITVQSGVPIVEGSLNDKPSDRVEVREQEPQLGVEQQAKEEVAEVESGGKREEGQEVLPEKPRDENSEIVPNQNLTDEEIAQLILEEEELLTDQGVLGVNFKKLRPRAAVLKGSKVLEELEKVETEPPAKVEQLRRTTTFLQKPQRPVPQPRHRQEQDKAEENEVEGYRVVIKKQQKRSVTDRLLEKGLLDPRVVSTPEYPSEAATPCATPEPTRSSASSRQGHSRPGSRADLVEVRETIEECETVREVERIEGTGSRPQSVQEGREESKVCSRSEEYIDKSADNLEDNLDDNQPRAEEGRRESIVASIEKQVASIAAQVDKQKIRELVSTEINLEKQLENVQKELLALKQLPSEIENHLRIVSEQLHMIMELSGAGSRRGSGEQAAKERVEETREYYDEFQEIERTEIVEVEERSSTAMSGETPRIIEPEEDEQRQFEAYEEDEEAETKELDEPISVKSADEECRVKKFIVSYETKLLKSRDPSPATSHGSFEPDPNLSAKDQVIQELQHRTGRKRSRDLWPQAKQLELTLGRRWRCPNDFFNDDMIAEVLCSQAEVIRGRAMGVNFKKYEKTNLPNYDHLMNSSVYKMIHKMEKEPKKGIPARPAKVIAAEDVYERAKSPALSLADDRSTRSVSH